MSIPPGFGVVWTDAAAEYHAALRLADNACERAFLASRLAECEAGGAPLRPV
jgi:predicted RNA polymerase sigma factor